LTSLRTELEALDRQLQAKQAEEQRLRGVISSFQARLGATPTRESELIALTRDYQTLQNNYQSLLAKQEDSKISANLERRQIGEQFKVLDPARVPERPFTPNRPLFNLIGALAGLGIGVGLTMLMEYRDLSFRTDNEVVSVLSLPVLAAIPLMMTKAEKRKARRRRVRVIAAAATTCVITAVLLVWRLDLWARLTR
jgi:capsular polysaccharide biosynthesis protein